MTAYPPKKLIVPLDFSKVSLAGLESAKSLGRRHRCMLEVISVQELVPDAAMSYGTTAMMARQWKDYRKWALGEMSRLTKDYAEGRVKLQCLQGYPSVALGRAAQRGGAAMIVMGTHGYTGVKRLMFGSLAETLARSTHVPLLTVHQGKHPLRLRRILVPVNMTPHSDRALAYALSLARAEGAQLTALYVASEDGGGDPRLLLRGHLLRLWGERRAAEARAVVRRGDPQREILEEAAQGKFDLVVLAAHRKPFWKEFVLGMTAERVLRYSPVPVLSMPSVGAAGRRKGTRSLVREPVIV